MRGVRTMAGSVIAACAAVALAACDAGPANEAARETGTAAPAPQAPARDTAPAVRPPASPAPAAPAPKDDAPVASGDARLDGFGPLRLGMPAAEAEAAWPGLLDGTGRGTTRRDCFHASVPGHSHFALMFDGGRFVRYGGSPDDLVAPGGGRRGMREAELQALYGNALQSKPDRFAPGGKLLSTQASGVAPSKVVFVLRPDGVVNEWRVGLSPQIDYDEGCESAG